jgi:hypothetical protein
MRKDATLTLSIEPENKQKLNDIAEKLGFIWGKKPSPSQLIDAIANGDIILSFAGEDIPKAYSPAQLKALKKAIAYFLEIEDFKSVQAISSLLSNQGEKP